MTRLQSICDIAIREATKAKVDYRLRNRVLESWFSHQGLPAVESSTPHITMLTFFAPLLLLAQSAAAAPVENVAVAAAATVGKIRGVRDPIYHLYLQASPKNCKHPVFSTPSLHVSASTTDVHPHVHWIRKFITNVDFSIKTRSRT